MAAIKFSGELTYIGTTAVYLRSMGADEAFNKVALREWPS